jgi:hypothetical protein
MDEQEPQRPQDEEPRVEDIDDLDLSSAESEDVAGGGAQPHMLGNTSSILREP